MSDTFENVANGVEAALHHQFGSAARIERIQQDDRSAFFGFTVDGEPFSLSVNITE